MHSRSLLLALLTLLFTHNTVAEIITKPVSYQADGTTLKGYIAYDDATNTKRPGILVVHEWWGHNDYAQRRARMLAKQGYVALALDMYGDGKQADHPKDASRFSSMVAGNLPLAKERFLAAYKLLQQQPQTNPDKIGAIGYCFGGGIVLAMARLGIDLDAVASFHGSLGLAAPLKQKISTRVLVLNGAADPFVKPEQIESFQREMSDMGVDYEFISYAGAKHAFTNPAADQFGQKFNIPLAYDKKADEASWIKLTGFLQQSFK